MKPLVLFSGLALASAGGLLALTYQGWQDEPSALSSLSSSTKTVKIEQGEAVSTPPATPPVANTETATVTPNQTETAPAREADADPATFDMVRVDEDGSAVLAGRAAPGSKVEILLDGEVLGETQASERGEWVFIPEGPMEKGAHKIELRETSPSGEVVRSQQSIALTVPDGDQPKPLIVLSETAKPSKVLQKPTVTEAASQTADEPEKLASAASQEVTQPGVDAVTAKVEPEVKPEAEPTPEVKADTAPAPAADTPARTLSVDVVDYDEQGRTTFSGRSAPGATVRVYVDGKFSGEAVANDAGDWALSATDRIEPGSHTLRTDKVAANGTVSERIELPFFRESSERIASLQAQRDSSAEQQTQQQAEPATTAPAASKPEPAPEVTEQSEPTPPAIKPVEQAAAPSTETDASSDTVAPAVGTSVPDPAKPELAAAETGKVVIQPGNNLWQISRVIYGEGVQYTVIYEANKAQIRNPDLIYPGQIFETPGMSGPESIDPSCRQPLAKCQ